MTIAQLTYALAERAVPPAKVHKGHVSEDVGNPRAVAFEHVLAAMHWGPEVALDIARANGKAMLQEAKDTADVEVRTMLLDKAGAYFEAIDLIKGALKS